MGGIVEKSLGESNRGTCECGIRSSLPVHHRRAFAMDQVRMGRKRTRSLLSRIRDDSVNECLLVVLPLDIVETFLHQIIIRGWLEKDVSPQGSSADTPATGDRRGRSSIDERGSVSRIDLLHVVVQESATVH
jgi:hypothetical protein